MNKKQLYGLMLTTNAYLPPLTDKSVTKRRLQELLSFHTIAPQKELGSLKLFHSDVPKRELVRAIIIEAHLDMAFWFQKGRLPEKNYLLQVLHSFNPVHPLLARSMPLVRQRRIFKVNQKCKKCVRRANRCVPAHYQDLPEAQQASRMIVPMNAGESDLLYAHRVICSRYDLVALKFNATEDMLSEGRFFNANVQHKLITQIRYIDRIIDSIKHLRYGNFV